MRMHVMSDLHLDHLDGPALGRFWSELDARILADKPDMAILAGDIGNGSMSVRDPQFNLEGFSKRYENVVFVPGNHEFWGSSIFSVENHLEKEIPTLKNVYFIQPNNPWGQFSGGTLWYPRVNSLKWVDYTYIEDGIDEISANHKFFKDHAMRDIVVSHMFPTVESINWLFAGSKYNVFFHGQLESWLDDKVDNGVQLPKLWIHGHTHFPFDYVSKYGFRVYCNPYGYLHENTNPRFFDRLLVEI